MEDRPTGHGLNEAGVSEARAPEAGRAPRLLDLRRQTGWRPVGRQDGCTDDERTRAFGGRLLELLTGNVLTMLIGIGHAEATNFTSHPTRAEHPRPGHHPQHTTAGHSPNPPGSSR